MHDRPRMDFFFRIVHDALLKMDPQRKCFRQVSGILMEQTVQETLVYLQSQLQGVTQANMNMCV